MEPTYPCYKSEYHRGNLSNPNRRCPLAPNSKPEIRLEHNDEARLHNLTRTHIKLLMIKMGIFHDYLLLYKDSHGGSEMQAILINNY